MLYELIQESYYNIEEAAHAGDPWLDKAKMNDPVVAGTRKQFANHLRAFRKDRDIERSYDRDKNANAYDNQARLSSAGGTHTINHDLFGSTRMMHPSKHYNISSAVDNSSLSDYNDTNLKLHTKLSQHPRMVTSSNYNKGDVNKFLNNVPRLKNDYVKKI